MSNINMLFIIHIHSHNDIEFGECDTIYAQNIFFYISTHLFKMELELNGANVIQVCTSYFYESTHMISALKQYITRLSFHTGIHIYMHKVRVFTRFQTICQWRMQNEYQHFLFLQYIYIICMCILI